MRLLVHTRSRLFRWSYLIVNGLLLCWGVYLLASGLKIGLEEGVRFRQTVNLVALLAACLFEVGILLFIVRSLRTGTTLLMKHLVFKNDGTPYRLGILLALPGALSMLLSGIMVTWGGWLGAMEASMRQFVGFSALIAGVNLLFVFLFFVTFRHESGTFEII